MGQVGQVGDLGPVPWPCSLKYPLPCPSCEPSGTLGPSCVSWGSSAAPAVGDFGVNAHWVRPCQSGICFCQNALIFIFIFILTMLICVFILTMLICVFIFIFIFRLTIELDGRELGLDPPCYLLREFHIVRDCWITSRLLRVAQLAILRLVGFSYPLRPAEVLGPAGQ